MKKFAKYLTTFIIIFCSLFVISGCGNKERSNFLNAKKDFTIEDTLSKVTNQTARVVLLYGQSNATGVASNEYLKEKNETDYKALKSGNSRAYINYITENGSNSSNSKFIKCTLGCGASKDYFGPEAEISRKLAAEYTSDKIFIIKYTWGGTDLNYQWLDGSMKRGHLYEAAMNFTMTSLDYLIAKGYKLDILGICWMQGESDALGEPKRYYDNTNNFVDYLRTDLKGYQSIIPFIDAGISESWTNYQTINKAKIDFANKSDLNVYIPTISEGLRVDTEPEENPDLAHYDSLSMVKLGALFAEELIDLDKNVLKLYN